MYICVWLSRLGGCTCVQKVTISNLKVSTEQFAPETE